MKNLRKSLIIGVMALTALSMTNFPVSAAAPQAGDLIKMDGLSAVYFLGNDGKRYVFPHSSVFFSWHKDFSGVVTVSASELQSYPLGGNIAVRPGTKLVKITTDPSVYAVEANGTLRKISSEADAIAIYGATWAKRVIDVSDAFFTNYTIGTPLTSGVPAAGTLVKNASSAAIYMFDGTNYRSIATEAAFNANRFDFANVITLSSAITAGGTAITTAEFAYDAQKGGTINVITSSGVTVSISANTAGSSSIISGSVSGGQALAEMASFNLTASNDGQAVIKTLKLKRTGVSSDSTFSNVYLYDGVTKLTDGASFSNGYVSFSNGNGIITIPAGQTKTLTVKADVAAKQTGNIGVAINAASDVVSSAASVTGSFPISGNIMSVVTASDMAVVTLDNTLGTAELTAKAGNTNTIIWSDAVNVTGKAVDFKYIAFKQIGSINGDDLANLSLYVDGSKVATSVLNNNDLAFNLATASRLNTGNHTIEVKADIIKGSSRTFKLSLQDAANAVFTDTNYNINVAPTPKTGSSFASASFKISEGTLSISADSTFNDTQIVKTATNATLSRFKIKAFGEDVKVNTLAINLDFAGTYNTATDKINDLVIVVDGTQVGSSKSVAITSVASNISVPAYGGTNLFVIPAGKEVIVEIKGSLSLDNDSVATNRTIKADMDAISAIGVTSYKDASIAGKDSVTTLTVVSGGLTVAKNSNIQNQNVSKNSQKVKIGSYILAAGSVEGVNISNVRINITATSTALDNITNLYISENTTPVNPQAANDFNTNLTIDKSQSKTIDVFADLGDVDTGAIQTTLAVTYKTTVSQSFGTTNASPVSGQIMTLATAGLTSVSSVSNSPAAGFVLGGTTATAANLKFIATNGAATINEVTFEVTSAVDAISKVTFGGVTSPVINDGSTKTVTLTGLNTAIAAGLQGVTIPVTADYNTVTAANQGGVDTGKNVKLTLTSIKYTVNGVQTTDTNATAGGVIPLAGVASNDMKLVAAYPTVVDTSSYTSRVLIPSGKSEVMKFSVTAPTSNSVNLMQVSLTPYFSYNLTNGKVWIYDANDLSTALNATAGTAITAAATFASDHKTDIAFTSPVTVNGTRNFVVYVDNTGTATTANGDYFRTDMVNSGWSWNDSTIANDAVTQITGDFIKEFTGTTFQK